jgi:hypothetical protein
MTLFAKLRAWWANRPKLEYYAPHNIWLGVGDRSETEAEEIDRKCRERAAEVGRKHYGLGVSARQCPPSKGRGR